MLREALGKLSKHTFAYAIAVPLMYGVGFLLVPFYTHYLSKSDYGVNELLSQFIAVLGLVAGKNMTNGMTRMYFEQKTPREQKAVISTTLLALGVAAAVVGGALAMGARWVAPLIILDSDAAKELTEAGTLDMLLLFRVTMAILVLTTIREVFFNYLQAQQRSTLFTVLNTIKFLLQLVLQVWFIAGLGLGLLGLFYGVLIGEAVSVTLLSLVMLPSIGLSFSRPLFGQLVAFTLPLIPNGLFMFVLQAGDRFVLKGLSGKEAVGIYSFAYRFGSIAMYLPLTPFLLVWWPWVFSINDEEKRRTLIGRIMPYFMFTVTAVVFGLALIARELALKMEGQPGYAAAWPAIAIVAAGYWFWSAFQIVQTGFYVRKITRHLPWLSGMAAVVNIGANFLLIPRIGYMGSAWATLLTFALLLVVTVAVARPVYPVDWPWRRVLQPALAAGALFAAALLVAPETFIAAVAVKLVVFAAWLVWMWFGGFLGAEERAAALGALAGFRRPRKQE